MIEPVNDNILNLVNELYNNLDAKDKIINEQALEIARLKEQLEYLRSNEYLNQVKWERNFNEELVKDLQQKIDKATEYINKTQMGEGYKKELLEILGDDKDE